MTSELDTWLEMYSFLLGRSSDDTEWTTPISEATQAFWAERSFEQQDIGNGTNIQVKIFGCAKNGARNSELVPYSLDLPRYSKALYLRYESANPDITVAFQLQQLSDSHHWIPHRSISFSAETVELNASGTKDKAFLVKPVGSQRVPVPNPAHRVVATILVQGTIALENVVVVDSFSRGGKNTSSRKNNGANASYVYIHDFYTYIEKVVGE